jgi:hypothetical protein
MAKKPPATNDGALLLVARWRSQLEERARFCFGPIVSKILQALGTLACSVSGQQDMDLESPNAKQISHMCPGRGGRSSDHQLRAERPLLLFELPNHVDHDILRHHVHVSQPVHASPC